MFTVNPYKDNSKLDIQFDFVENKIKNKISSNYFKKLFMTSHENFACKIIIHTHIYKHINYIYIYKGDDQYGYKKSLKDCCFWWDYSG